MPRPDPSIVFHVQYSHVTGEDSNLVISFNGSDQGELRSRLTQVYEVVSHHVKKTHNDKVLKLTDEIRARVEQAKRDIIRADRRSLVEQGLLRPDLVDAIVADGGNGAADPAGPADLRPDS